MNSLDKIGHIHFMVRFCVCGFSSKPFSAFFGIPGYVQCILLLNVWPLLSQVKEVSLYVSTGEMWEQNVACGGLSQCLSGRESTCNAGDVGSISGSGRSSREGNGNRLQYSCLENSRDRGAWQGTVHGIERVTAPLSDWAYTHSKQKIEHSLPNQAFHKDKLSFQTVSTFKSKKRTGFHFKHLYFHVVSPNQKRRNVFWPLRFSYSPKGKCINVLLCLFYVGKFLAFIICKNHD